MIDPSVSLRTVPNPPKTVIWDLSFDFRWQPGVLKGVWTYNAELWNRETIERAAAEFDSMLTSAAANPSTPIDQL